jgi:phosphoglycerol transferase
MSPDPTATAAPAGAPPQTRVKPGARARSRRVFDSAIADAVGIVAATAGLLVITLRLWEANLRVPFVYNATPEPPLAYAPDAPYYLMITKGLVDHGSYLRIPNLGWPFSLQLYDNPESGDNLQLAMLRALGFVLRDAVLTVNVYYLLTYVAVSLAAWFVLRRLGVSRLVAAVIAILYSFLPYHFARGEAHVLLSGYFMVPIATLLILQVLSDKPPFTARRDSPEPRWRLSLWDRRALPWVLACAALGSTGPYYAFFAVLLLAAAVAVDLVARRSWRRAASGAVAAGIVLVVLLLNLSPSFLYWQSHGQNDAAIPRGISETEVNGLRVAELVLPRVDHRIGAFADAQRKSDRFSPVATSERGQQLGLIGALGFAGLLVFTLSRLLRRGRADDAADSALPLGSPVEIGKRLGLLTVIGLVVATVSGISLLISAVGVRYIRSYNRISIFIAFFALIAAAFALDWLVARVPRWHGRAVLAGVLCLALLAVGIFDQTSTADVPDYRALERAWDSDETFMHGIQKELGPGAAVFQMPYVFFPEAGTIVGTGPYDQVRGWLHADSLRWSWGSVRGRDGDWQGALVRLEKTTDALDALTAVGFSGLMIDRAGFDDHGALLEYGYTTTLNQEPQVSPDRRLLFYDLRPWSRDLRNRLSPAQIEELRRTTLAARAAPPGART